MKPKTDIIGAKFAKLTVVSCVGKNKRREYIYECLCDCGNKTKVVAPHLKSGNTKSCGCLKVDKLKKHGDSRERLYYVWRNIKSRCSKGNPDSKYYYDRGIMMCKEWKESYVSFKTWALKSGYKEGLTIERTDNQKGYTPENCTMATRKDQIRNRRNTIMHTQNGKTKSLGEWAEITGISYNTLYGRRYNNRVVITYEEISE